MTPHGWLWNCNLPQKCTKGMILDQCSSVFPGCHNTSSVILSYFYILFCLFSIIFFYFIPEWSLQLHVIYIIYYVFFEDSLHLILQSRQTWKDWPVQTHHNVIMPGGCFMYKVLTAVSACTRGKRQLRPRMWMCQHNALWAFCILTRQQGLTLFIKHGTHTEALWHLNRNVR